MSNDDALERDMHRLLGSLEATSPAADQDLLDRLLDGHGQASRLSVSAPSTKASPPSSGPPPADPGPPASTAPGGQGQGGPPTTAG